MKNFVRALLVVVAMGMGMNEASAASGRGENKFGLFLGIDTPAPSLLAFNLGYHLGEAARISAGYGSISATTVSTTGTAELKATTIGGALNFYIPEWSFSPTVGLGFASVSVTATGTAVSTAEVGGFSASASHMYITTGFDWNTHFGFYMGFGAHISMKSGVGALPYLNLGWFF